jgi:ligand-binding sensor protein
MEELIELLKDGHARSVELLAMELKTDTDDVRRKLEYLEYTGVIKRVNLQVRKCASCNGCSGNGESGCETCKGCLPEGGFKNMGEMWEVVR